MYKTVAEFDADEILQKTARTNAAKKFTINEKNYVVKMNSLRYEVFKKSKTCCCCGRTGTTMLLQFPKYQNCKNPHFNLYAVEDGNYILMTKDHIIPASKGGRDHLDNLRTMCQECNAARKNDDITLEKLLQRVFELREKIKLTAS